MPSKDVRLETIGHFGLEDKMVMVVAIQDGKDDHILDISETKQMAHEYIVQKGLTLVEDLTF